MHNNHESMVSTMVIPHGGPAAVLHNTQGWQLDRTRRWSHGKGSDSPQNRVKRRINYQWTNFLWHRHCFTNDGCYRCYRCYSPFANPPTITKRRTCCFSLPWASMAMVGLSQHTERPLVAHCCGTRQPTVDWSLGPRWSLVDIASLAIPEPTLVVLLGSPLFWLNHKATTNKPSISQH